MKGYDKKEALDYILARIDHKEHAALDEGAIASILRSAIDLDLEYMEREGVLSGGMEGDAYYDDDEAFEYLTEAICSARGANEDMELHIARLVDAYMELQQSFLTEKGMIDWE